jgi:hypothetical protein
VRGKAFARGATAEHGDAKRTLAIRRALAARVRREVAAKLTTGLKNPRKR